MILTLFKLGTRETKNENGEKYVENIIEITDSYKKLKDAVTKVTDKYKAFKETLGDTSFALIKYIANVLKSKAGTEELRVSLTSLFNNKKFLGFFTSLANAVVAFGVALGASAIIKHIQEQKELINTTAENAQTTANEVQSATESLKNLASEYENLGNRSSWDSDDYAQARDIQEEIVDLLKQQAGFDETKLNNLDLQNGKYEDQKKVLEDITAEQLRASKYALVENVTAQGNKLKETAKKTKSTTLLTDPTDEAIGVLGKAGYGSFNGDTNQFSFGSYDPKDINSILDYYDRLDAASKLLIDNMGSEKVASSGLYQWIIKTRDGLKDEVDAYRESTDAVEDNELAQRKLETARALTNTNARALNGALATLQNTIDGFDASKLVDLLNGIGTELLTPDQQAALDKIREFMTGKGFTTEQIQAFVDVLVEIGRVSPAAADGVQTAAEAAQAAAEAFDDANKRIDNLQSAYQTMSACVDEYNKNGWVTVDNLQALSQLEPQYLACLEKRDGQMSINTESVQKLAEAEIDLYRVSLLNNTIQGILATTSIEKANQILGQAQSDMSQSKQMLRDAKKQALQDAYEKYGSGDEFYAIRKAINQQIDSWENLDELWLDLKDKDPSTYLSKTSSASKSTSKSVSDAASAFDTLVSAMKEYNQYGYVSANTAKSLAGLEDKYTACLTKQNGKLVLNTAKFKDYIKQQIVAANAADDDGKSAYELMKILDWLNSSVDSETISFEQLTDAIKGYGTAMDEAKEKTDAIKSAFSGLSEVMNNKTDRNNPFGLLDSDDVEKQHEALLQLVKDTDVFKSKAYNPETGEVDFNSTAFKDSVVEYLNGMADAAAQTGGAGAKAIEKNWRDAAKAIADGKISVEEFYNGLGYSLEKATKEIDDFQSGFSDITDIVDEYNLYGGLSIDNYQKLMALSPDYLSCLKLEGDQLVFNEVAYKQLLIDKLNDMITTYEQTDATKELAKRLKELRDGLLDSKTGFKSAKDAAEEFKSAMSDLKDVFSSLLSLFEKFNTDKDNDLKLWGEAMTEDIDKRIEALNKQKEALEKANDEEERAITLAKLKAELEKARTQRTVRKLTSNGYEWVADESAVKEAKDNLSDQQREWRKEDAEKAIDDQIDKLNELKDKYSEAMNLIGTSLDDYNKKLRYTAQIQDMTFSEMEGRVDEYKNKIIASFTNAAPVSGIQNLISNIESLINTLTKLNNVYSWIQTGEYQDKGTTGLWNTIKGFFNKGKSENINKSFKDTFDAAKKAFNAGKKQLTDTATTGANDVINAIINQIKTSGNGLIETFSGIWKKIKGGAQSLFSGSGEGGGIVSTVVNGFKAIGNAVSKSKIGTAVVSGGGKLLAGAGKLIGTAGSALAAAGPYAIPIAAAAGLGIYSGVKSIKHQKEIWSNKEDGFGKKAMKSVATFFWDISPIGGIVNLCKDIFGKNKEIADNTKNNGKDNTSSGATNSSEGIVIGNIKGKKAGGSRSIKQSGQYNVDERGHELLVRQPASGRYTYLETGDGVVPADITSRLFDMGGNPDRWFTEQMERNAGISNVQNRTIEGDKITIGDIYIQNPVGGVDDLAREINQRMPAMFKQIQSKR